MTSLVIAVGLCAIPVFAHAAGSGSLFERILRATLRGCASQLQSASQSLSNFPIHDHQIQAARAHLAKDFLAQTLFVLPKNDGEAFRAVQILMSLGVPLLHVSSQGWGASLDREVIPYDLLRKARRVVVFEMPGAEAEARMRKGGKEVVIIDHHGSQEFPDRYQKTSSLEQLAELLGWPLSEDDRDIAVNDRGYIVGLRALGLSDDRIRQIRSFDLQAQGRTQQVIDQATEQVRSLIPFLPTVNGVVLYQGENVDTGLLQQELALSTPDGRINFLGVTGTVRFSGQPEIVQALSEINLKDFGLDPHLFDMYHGGDAEGGSMFFGLKPKNRSGRLPASLVSAIEKIVFEKAAVRSIQGLVPETELKFSAKGDPKHPALILIHGLDSARATFENVVDNLAKDYFVVSYDLRGHGESQARGENYSTSVMAQDLLALMDHLKIEKAHILGHSMGARVATRFAETHPHRTGRLVIEDMDLRPRSQTPSENERWAKEYGRRKQLFAERVYPSRQAALAALQTVSGSEAESVLNRRSKKLADGRVQLLFRPDVSLLFGLQARREDLRPALQQILQQRRVLVMGSVYAGLVDDTEQAWLTSLGPAVELEMFDVGHTIHREDAEKFLVVLREFLTRD